MPLVKMSQPHHISLSTSNYLLEMIFVRLRKKNVGHLHGCHLLDLETLLSPRLHCVPEKKNEITLLNNIIKQFR